MAYYIGGSAIIYDVCYGTVRNLPLPQAAINCAFGLNE